jgi:AhpD family alkylhydroperoxidase
MTKELINIGISISDPCEWCIAFHARAARDADTSEDGIISAGFMSVLMHGGPALMYMMLLRDALAEFAAGRDR